MACIDGPRPVSCSGSLVEGLMGAKVVVVPSWIARGGSGDTLRQAEAST